jgi:hypothetical protein
MSRHRRRAARGLQPGAFDVDEGIVRPFAGPGDDGLAFGAGEGGLAAFPGGREDARICEHRNR